MMANVWLKQLRQNIKKTYEILAGIDFDNCEIRQPSEKCKRNLNGNLMAQLCLALRLGLRHL